MSVKISEHFSSAKLVRYTLPTATMMVFTSIYGVIDGLFVSNFAGKEPFAALNLIYPFVMILCALGFMFGTGGTALVSKTLGEGKRDRANGLFSMLVLATFAAGVLGSVVIIAGVRSVAEMMGASGTLADQAVLYGSIVALSMPFFVLQQSFQSYFSAAGKPKIGLAVIVVAGVANIALDALFIVGFGWGLAGAAIATAISEVLGGSIPVIYFVRNNSSALRLVKPIVDFKALGKACVNGSSELVSNISMSLVAMLYNYQLMAILGADGVAAYGVIEYLMWIFISLFMGFSVGVSPLIAYQYGAKNTVELSSLFKKSLAIVGVLGIILTAAALTFARPIALLFVGYDEGVITLVTHALSIYSWVFLLCGFSIFASAFFTALNNGLVSAAISFLRSLVFEIAAIIILPIFFGEMGIWSAIVVAEAASLIVAIAFLASMRKVYNYL